MTHKQRRRKTHVCVSDRLKRTPGKEHTSGDGPVFSRLMHNRNRKRADTGKAALILPYGNLEFRQGVLVNLDLGPGIPRPGVLTTHDRGAVSRMHE